MSLSKDLISKFVKATNDKTEKKKETTVYGTVVMYKGLPHVRLDGSDILTPVTATTSIEEGSKVSVLLKDHDAVVTGNVTSPSVNGPAVTGVVNDAATAIVTEGIENYDKQIRVSYAHITSGVIDNANIDAANVNNLNANYAHITNGVIDNAKIGVADVNDLNANYAHVTNGEIDNATIGVAKVTDLNANYAHLANGVIDNATIDVAKVNAAWIENGVIKDGAIADAQIIGVSANKITAGTIDASKINVTNLNADNLTVGTINGARIGNSSIDLDKLSQEVPTKEYLDGIAEDLQGQIDGAVETWTTKTIPTLNNYPADEWKTSDDRKKHVGDVCYVINSGSTADGYCYRFAQGQNGTYEWVLIKDSDVTKALQDLLTAQGDINGLKTFKTDISKWKTETDDSLASAISRTTQVETDLGNKVETSTFNETKQQVESNASSITTLQNTVKNKADGSIVTSLSNTVNTIKQTVDGNKSAIQSLTETVNDKADGSTVTNLSTIINSVQQSTDSNTSAIQSINRTMELKANNSTVENINTKVTSLTQDLSGFKTTVSDTYATKSYAEGQAADAKDEAIADTTEKLKVYSTITQTAEAIKSLVSSAGGEATYIQTSDGFTWNFSSNMTAVEDETARSNASTAVETANGAASDASTAKSNASTALSTANTARSTADIAKTNASTALSTANAAKSTANTANSNASTALTTANQAKTDAADARKVATNYMSFQNGTGLIIGDMTASTLGKNTLIDSEGMAIRDGSNELARFKEDTVSLGNGALKLKYTVDKYGVKSSSLSSKADNISIDAGNGGLLVSDTQTDIQFGRYHRIGFSGETISEDGDYTTADIKIQTDKDISIESDEGDILIYADLRPSLDPNGNSGKIDLSVYNGYDGNNTLVLDKDGITYKETYNIDTMAYGSERTITIKDGHLDYDFYFIDNTAVTDDEKITSGSMRIALNDLKNIGDSGWVTPTFNSNVSQSTTVTDTPVRYRKLNGIVYLSGHVAVNNFTSGTTLFTLPSGYRPATIQYYICATGGHRVARVFVRKTGVVTLEWIVDPEKSSSITGNIGWVSLAGISFIADN